MREEIDDGGMRQRHRGRVAQGMSLHRISVPHDLVQHQFHRLGAVVYQRKQTDGPGRDTQVLQQAFGRSHAQLARRQQPSQRRQADALIKRHDDEKMPPPLLVAHEQILHHQAGHGWHMNQCFIDGMHGRVLDEWAIAGIAFQPAGQGFLHGDSSARTR
ncbi:hypothetical protein D3C81_1706790 [compost metagenome]